MMRRALIVFLVLLATLLSVGAIASFFRPVDFVPVQSDLRLLRVSFRAGDVQVVLTRQVSIKTTVDDGVHVSMELDKAFRIGTIRMSDGWDSAALMSILTPLAQRGQSWAWRGFAYWHMSQTNLVSVDWSKLSSLNIVASANSPGSFVSFTAISPLKNSLTRMLYC